MTQDNWISRRRFKALAVAAGTAMMIGSDDGVAGGSRAEKPATFLLVHGAWHGGWCYTRVADRLRSLGHRVYAPTLTGLGERSHLSTAPAVSCSTHIQDILNVIQWERLTDIVLCGHSYGGMVIGAVADRVAEKIRSIVYLDSVVPESGKSFLDLVAAAPEYTAQLVASLGAHGGQMLPPFAAAAFNVNSADRAMVDAHCTPQSFATFTERLTLTGAWVRIPRKTYIRATGWQQSPFGAFYEKAKASPEWTATQVDCGHDVMLDRPDELARLLQGAAGV